MISLPGFLFEEGHNMDDAAVLAIRTSGQNLRFRAFVLGVMLIADHRPEVLQFTG